MSAWAAELNQQREQRTLSLEEVPEIAAQIAAESGRREHLGADLVATVPQLARALVSELTAYGLDDRELPYASRMGSGPARYRIGEVRFGSRRIRQYRRVLMCGYVLFHDPLNPDRVWDANDPPAMSGFRHAGRVRLANAQELAMLAYDAPKILNEMLLHEQRSSEYLAGGAAAADAAFDLLPSHLGNRAVQDGTSADSVLP